jgi:deoxycytidine triphosphate deaminase
MNKEGIIHMQILIEPFLHTENGIKRDGIELGYKQLFTNIEMFETKHSKEVFLLKWQDIGQKLFAKMEEVYKISYPIEGEKP